MPQRTRRTTAEAGPALTRRSLVGTALASPTLGDAYAGSTAAPPDAGLLSLCELAWQLDGDHGDEGDAAERWDGVLAALSALPARSARGLRAKTRLLLALSPASDAAATGQALSPEEALLVSLLRDVIAMTEDQA